MKNLEEKFWLWFSENHGHIYSNIGDTSFQKEIFESINVQLNKIDENLTFEFSPIRENGVREFSISADGMEESFPNVRKLIKLSPNLENWKFNAFRQRMPNDNYVINYDGYTIGYDDIYYRYSTSNNELGIELNIRNYDESGKMQNAIYILLDGLLGEYDVTMTIDWIDWKKLDENEMKSLQKLVKLRDLVDAWKK
ncbi:hypothetical protein [Chryseobacterium sp. CP-77]|uniref:hypothetical protein n=1 Tax=Chryseobacterium sp. CP-77 TaxID=3116594 RepID=UPI002ED6A309